MKWKKIHINAHTAITNSFLYKKRNQTNALVYLQLHATFHHRDRFKVIHRIFTSQEKSSEASKMTRVPLIQENDKDMMDWLRKYTRTILTNNLIELKEIAQIKWGKEREYQSKKRQMEKEIEDNYHLTGLHASSFKLLWFAFYTLKILIPNTHKPHKNASVEAWRSEKTWRTWEWHSLGIRYDRLDYFGKKEQDFGHGFRHLDSNMVIGSNTISLWLWSGK